MAAMERSWATAILPATRCQVRPKSVDLYRPTPASESLEPLGSPVPTYIVAPIGSVGSWYSEPMALDAKPTETECQTGWGARPLRVTQIPPPAAPTQTGHNVFVQNLETSRAVTRPETVVARPVSLAWVETLPTVGPTSCQD